jgi:hypothetical protein
MKKSMITAVLALLVMTATAQEKPFRIGLKFGLPNLAGLGIEYVSPVASNRLAFAGDFSYIPIPFNTNDFDGTFSAMYVGFGTSFYFKADNNGRGPYFHLGAGMLNLGLSGTQSSTMTASDNTTIPVTAEIGTNISAFFLMGKLGAKWGNTLYFRPEIGYGLFSIDDAFKFSATFTAQDPVTGQPVSESQDFSVDFKLPISGGPVFTLGIGIAF